MDPRLSLDEYYLNVVKLLATRSTCVRRAVGAIITDDRGIVLGTGYNGVPRAFDHCTMKPCPGAEDPPGNTSRCLAVHAEMNAIIHCHDMRNAHTLYVSCVPCFQCAKVIANTPIQRIIVSSTYSDMEGYRLLANAGKPVVVHTMG
jgi:dCMP deaminase